MKITITKDTIILIGLLYNYLSNYELELYEWRIKNFLDTIETKLEKEDIIIEITEEQIENQTNEINKYLEKDENKKIYKLINICNIEYWYKKLPKELINFTLKNDILSTIYSENLKLLVPTKKQSFPCQKIKKIKTDKDSEPKETLIKYLEKEETRNIKIESIIKTKKEHETEYTITYNCDKYLETIDMHEILVKRIKKKKEVLELLFEKRKFLLTIHEPNTEEFKEVETTIEKVKNQLYGKINTKKVNNEIENKNNHKEKEMVDLASKCSKIFEIESIEIPENLKEKLKSLDEAKTLKKEPSVTLVKKRKRKK